jgi:hypothetical protein
MHGQHSGPERDAGVAVFELRPRRSAHARFLGTDRCSCYPYASDYRERGAWGMFRHEMRHGLLIEDGIHHLDQL